MFNKVTATALTLTATAAASVAIAAAPAQALVISTSVGQYDVTTVEGSWNSLQTQLSQQVWFTGDLLQATPDNNSALAEEFAGLVGASFGFGNSLGLSGPFFVFGTNTPITGAIDRGNVGYAAFGRFVPSALLNALGGANMLNELDTSRVFAIATPVTAIPTPALLPGLIGLGAVVWRKRRDEAATTDA